jgi:hypothetical protein
MDDAETPPTQPAGALVPPTKVPGTAVATATPEPPNRHARHPEHYERSAFRRWLSRTLNAVDQLADSVAAGLGLR